MNLRSHSRRGTEVAGGGSEDHAGHQAVAAGPSGHHHRCRTRPRPRTRPAVRIAGRQGGRQRSRRRDRRQRRRRLGGPGGRRRDRRRRRRRPSPRPHSVSSFDGAKAIIDLAVEAFGDLHVVVNNAGILRDRMLVSMSEQEFDDVVAVHLKGTFNVSRPRRRLLARAAKAGDTASRGDRQHELGRRSARQRRADQLRRRQGGHRGDDDRQRQASSALRRRVNCIAPIARTRLTLQTPGIGEVMGQSVFDPENISPLVAVLASADCPFNGQVFSVYGGSVGIYAGWSIAEEVTRTRLGRPTNCSEAMRSLPRSVEVKSQMGMLAEVAAGRWAVELGPGQATMELAVTLPYADDTPLAGWSDRAVESRRSTGLPLDLGRRSVGLRRIHGPDDAGRARQSTSGSAPRSSTCTRVHRR